MNILVFGADGQLGRCLVDQAKDSLLDLVCFNRGNGDITKKPVLETIFEKFQPRLIINCAAYTQVDKAEVEHTQAFAVNVNGPKNLAMLADKYACPLIHISTDYVFDGQASRAYQASDPINPKSIYGKTKYQGEQAIRQHLEQHLIIRTSWVFSEYGANFVKTMLRLSGERSELNVVADQQGCPTYAGDLAAAILKIAARIFEGKKDWGTFHYCGGDVTTWHQFAETIFDKQRQLLGCRRPQVNPIPSSAYLSQASRPMYSVLDCTHTWQTWGLNPPIWQAALAPIIKQLSPTKANINDPVYE